MSKEKKQLTSAPPPLHTVALLGLLLIGSLACLPELESIDRVATVETFTRTAFPESVISSPKVLGSIRLAFAAYIFFISLVVFRQGFSFDVTYDPRTKLNACHLRLQGMRAMYPFTMWSWNLLGVAFALSGSIPILVACGKEHLVKPWLLRSALITFEIVAPCAMLVACVVKYALWPILLKSGTDTAILREPKSLITHNMNVVMVLVEILLLGGLPIRISDMVFAPLFGGCYAVFSWFMATRWDPEHGPQFLYHILDTTLPGALPSIMILSLYATLTFFFLAFSLGQEMTQHLGGLQGHMAAVVLASLAVCRVRD